MKALINNFQDQGQSACMAEYKVFCTLQTQVWLCSEIQVSTSVNAPQLDWNIPIQFFKCSNTETVKKLERDFHEVKGGHKESLSLFWELIHKRSPYTYFDYKFAKTILQISARSFQVKVWKAHCFFSYLGVYPAGIKIARKSVLFCLPGICHLLNQLLENTSFHLPTAPQYMYIYSALSAEEDIRSLRNPKLFCLGHILMIFPTGFQVMAVSASSGTERQPAGCGLDSMWTGVRLRTALQPEWLYLYWK